jgi:hypothetical protein
MNPITYTSTQDIDYADAIGKAETLQDLTKILTAYRNIAPDAFEAAPKDDSEFYDFIVGLSSERRGKFAGETWYRRYGVIAIPEFMFRVTMLAGKFGVPWGLMFNRLQEAGKITYDGESPAVFTG